MSEPRPIVHLLEGEDALRAVRELLHLVGAHPGGRALRRHRRLALHLVGELRLRLDVRDEADRDGLARDAARRELVVERLQREGGGGEVEVVVVGKAAVVVAMAARHLLEVEGELASVAVRIVC